MFCSSCGKQLPDGTNFCIYCGARQNVAAGQQSQSPKTPPKKKNNIVITLLVVLGVFLLGKFVIAPAMFSDSDKDDDYSAAPDSYMLETKEETEKVSYDYEDVKTKIYEIKAETVMSTEVTLLCHDGIVASVIGYSSIFDFSIDNLDEFKKAVEAGQEYIELHNLENAKIEPTESEYSYSVMFTFTKLDMVDHEKAVELAAAFMGFTVDDGKISVDAAEKILLDNGYTLKEEY